MGNVVGYRDAETVVVTMFWVARPAWLKEYPPVNRVIQTSVIVLFSILLTACNEQVAPPPTAQTAASNRTETLYPVEALLKPRPAAPPHIEEKPKVPVLPTAPVVVAPLAEAESNHVAAVEEVDASEHFPESRQVHVPADVLERAQNGDRLAQLEVGKLYGEKWRFEESNVWYLKAAEQGDARAEHIMGVRYTFGQGVEKDAAEAGKWFLLAAEQGHAGAQYSVGLRWVRGEAGEPQDFAEAAKWFRLAADQGHANAQVSLGRRYANGEGVDMDYIEAYKWMWLAKGRDPDAKKAMSELTPKMTAEQISQAKMLAKGFVPKPPTPITGRAR
ncbi:MAG: hypothetical protein JWM68_1181 [Verrucomicrobiales bacterium]|nr:hypothetical protein [Verrucomicrobiales bacterium]